MGRVGSLVKKLSFIIQMQIFFFFYRRDQCSRTCGGGWQRRYRICNIRDEAQETCFGINTNEEDRIRYTEQKHKCQVQNCPGIKKCLQKLKCLKL